MTPTAIALAVLQFGPTIIPLLAKLAEDIRAGRGNTEVTEADWVELSRLAGQTGEDIYRRLGVTPPPAA